MQSLINELRVEIFKYVKTPIALILTDHDWYTVSKDPYVRADWLIFKYGKSHAFFHALRLGESFIKSDVMKALIAKDATISRYFIQRLLMHYGSYDENLVENNANPASAGRIHDFRKKLRAPWSSQVPLPIFTELITEGCKLLKDKNIQLKGNDMELFHFLSAGPLVITQAPQRLLQNLPEIEDLILNKKFIPFPPRPRLDYEDTIEYHQLIQERAHDVYPPKDGYENSRQLNVVARAILIYPNLVNMWKEIGYYEICSDVNELVMQGALLILFPPTPPDDWECPSVVTVVERYKQLISHGFRLTENVIEEVFRLFENRLDEIGEILIESFKIICNKSVSDMASSCLIQAIKPERNHRKTDLLDFLIDRIDQPEKALHNALKHYDVGFKFSADSIKSVTKIRSLSVHSNVYYWVLKKYGTKFEATQKCFEDILESRVWIDLKLQETPERDVPENLTRCAFNSICSIYLEFCNERVPFMTNHLLYLQLVNNEEIIKPFFGISLPIVFGLQLKYEYPFDINYKYDRPKVNSIQNSIKRKFNEMNNDQLDWNEMKEWFKLLDNIYNDRILSSNSDLSETFKMNFKESWERIIMKLTLLSDLLIQKGMNKRLQYS